MDADLYDICGRVAEISPRLKLVELEDDKAHAWAVMETGDDGVEYLVFKVWELDARVIRRLHELFSVPFEQRLQKVAEENHRFEEQEKENAADELYERVGAPMWSDLERCGFIQRPVSYPKAGVATRGRYRR